MKIKRILDVTRRIHPNMAIWPGDDGVQINRVASMKEGASVNLSSIKLGLHTGTHVDAPFHFVDEGIRITSLDLSRFIGNVKVFELAVEKYITREDITKLPINEGDIVFFKTPNSSLPDEGPFNKEFIYIDESAAKYLVEKGIKTVGVDYLSVEGYEVPNHPTHTILLSNCVGIIEGLYLKDVREGEYFFSCLPLRIEDVEGSPVRAVLIEFEA